jgi:hypothetical protein
MPTFLASLILVAASCPNCDPVWRETQLRHERPDVQGQHFDPQESDPKLAEVFAAADRKAERKVGNVKRDKHFIFKFWREKKKILKREYGIAWKTPAELSPTVAFDDYGQPLLTAAEKERVKAAVAPRMNQSEGLIQIWREYDGKISVTTKSSADNEVRIYHLTGQDGAWAIVGPFVIAFD